MAAPKEMIEQNLQCNILYLQQQHASTLKGLHEEIRNLQKKNAELAFQMAMQTVISPEEDVFKKKSETLVKELYDQKIEFDEVKEETAKKQKKIEMLEQKLRAQEKKFIDENQLLKNKIRTLKSEVDCKSNNIAVLTHQLHSIKKDTVNCKIPSSPISDDVIYQPAPPKSGAPGSSRRRSLFKRNVTSVESDRRPNSSSTVESSLPDPAPFLFHKDLNIPEVKIRPVQAPLPPIGGSQDSDRDESPLMWAVRDIKIRDNSPKREILELAVDQIKTNTWRKNHSHESTQSK